MERSIRFAKRPDGERIAFATVGSGPPVILGPAACSHLEVLRLLVAGQSNLQIGDALVISSSTVAKHVSSILSKTGTANRVEATTYAYRHNLV